MKKILKKTKGITLIALIITIIILLILAGIAVYLIFNENGIIGKTRKADNSHEISEIKDTINMEIEVEDNRIRGIRYMNTDEVDALTEGINENYKSKIGVYREQITYLGDPQSEEGIFMKENGFDVIDMTPDEFKYYIELGVLEDSVNEGTEIGRELQTNQYIGTIKIGDNIYGIDWFLIGNYTDEEKESNKYNKQFEDLKLKDTTHAPYLVNYDKGIVLSIDGMVMYQAQIVVHSFNDMDKYLASAITYVNSYTEKTAQTYGNLISTAIYQGKVDNYGGGKNIYKGNNGELQYDEKGALILDNDNAIPVIEIDNKFKIEDGYSINATIEGDWNQINPMPGDSYANSIVALSEANTRYLAWIGVYRGYLQVYSFYQGAAISNIRSETTRKGFTSIDLSKYQGQKINIQVTAVRDGETNVYINGEKVKTFESGSSKMTFKYTALGDLRVGRNLKFVGKIYEFGIYGIAIDEEGVQNNWERAKQYVEN